MTATKKRKRKPRYYPPVKQPKPKVVPKAKPKTKPKDAFPNLTRFLKAYPYFAEYKKQDSWGPLCEEYKGHSDSSVYGFGMVRDMPTEVIEEILADVKATTDGLNMEMVGGGSVALRRLLTHKGIVTSPKWMWQRLKEERKKRKSGISKEPTSKPSSGKTKKAIGWDGGITAMFGDE